MTWTPRCALCIEYGIDPPEDAVTLVDGKSLCSNHARTYLPPEPYDPEHQHMLDVQEKMAYETALLTCKCGHPKWDHRSFFSDSCRKCSCASYAK